MKPLLPLLTLAATLHAAPPEPKFRAITIDDKIQIGYGVAVADVDGDKLPDILLADKKQFVWYRNPGAEKSADPASWTKFLLAENLTKNDNVCLAAQDIDGDGKCEIAVGAEWNPGDTVNSGAVFYLTPPADRTQKWEAVKFPNVEPTTHRMKWIELEKVEGRGPKVEGKSPASPSTSDPRLSTSAWGLVVVPLHGRGNKNGEGAPVKVLVYHPPTSKNDAKGDWKADLVDASMHMTHNFEILPDGLLAGKTVVFAGREGLRHIAVSKGKWESLHLENELDRPAQGLGAGEVRTGRLPETGTLFYTAVEPMHGNVLAFYPHLTDAIPRTVLTDKLTEGHALACGDVLGIESDQIVVGWRGTPSKDGSIFGIHLWTPLDKLGHEWRDSAVDDGGMACEDLVLADINGDGKLDIIASGRATHNVKVYFNETPR